nr:39S ribosomal protein L40, mitochondrial isoform X1 [Oryctolagus cuniculus]
MEPPPPPPPLPPAPPARRPPAAARPTPSAPPRHRRPAPPAAATGAPRARPPPPPPQPHPLRRSSSGGSRATPEVTARTCQIASAGNCSPRGRGRPGAPGRRRAAPFRVRAGARPPPREALGSGRRPGRRASGTSSARVAACHRVYLAGALGVWRTQIRDTHQRASLFSFWELLPTRAEPLRKKKKVDPKKDQAVKERLKKRIRKLEKATQELIPIEDFITPAKLLDKARQRPQVELSFEESERRALLLKKWSLYKQQEHERERDAIRALVAAQQEALQELQLESPELYSEAIKRDPGLFPFEKEGPHYTPPVADYQPPEGRYNDITKVYTQVEFKR